MNKDIKKTEDAKPVKKAVGISSNLLNRVRNFKIKGSSIAAVNEAMDKLKNIPGAEDTAFAQAQEKMAAYCMKAAISSEHPEYYKYFKDMDYKQLVGQIDKSKITGGIKDMMTFTLPQEAVQVAQAQGLYSTSFSISPNSFWANVTNILNEVTVGNNEITTGDSFNAWDFYRTGILSSGEAALRTMGQTLSGVCLLNQNVLVPENTQMLKGYQASLGVFINVDDPQNVGGGTGIGLFVMYSTPINVLKLAVTEPQQFSKMVRIFQAVALNTREYSLWVIATYNMLSGISNIIVDNYNTNIRNCLNGTLFPAIQIMKNPTNEFNCGLISTQVLVSDNNNATDLTTASPIELCINYQHIVDGYYTYDGPWPQHPISDILGTVRCYNNQSYILNGNTYNMINFTSPYNVPGSANYPRIQTSKASDMYLIVSPEFFVGLKSGTLSQLFHWEFQRLEAYIPPENIKMLYKQVDIPSGYLNDSTVTNTLNNSGYAYNVNAVLGNRWFPSNVIYLVTKPADINNWTANYGYVWTEDMDNTWGAGMIKTTYLHYALYGGVLPWANGCCFYFKNLMNLVSDNTQAIMTDFSLGVPINQKQSISTTNGSGQN